MSSTGFAYDMLIQTATYVVGRLYTIQWGLTALLEDTNSLTRADARKQLKALRVELQSALSRVADATTTEPLESGKTKSSGTSTNILEVTTENAAALKKLTRATQTLRTELSELRNSLPPTISGRGDTCGSSSDNAAFNDKGRDTEPHWVPAGKGKWGGR